MFVHALAPKIRAPHYILVGLKIKGVPTSLSLSLSPCRQGQGGCSTHQMKLMTMTTQILMMTLIFDPLINWTP